MARATKVPATFPELEKNPPCLLEAAVTTVWVDAGGAVGVTVNVLTWPVTVITDSTGVAVHVEEDDVDEADVVVGVGVVDGVEVVVGVGVGVDVVVGVSNVMDLRVGCCVVVVGVVELVDGVYMIAWLVNNPRKTNSRTASSVTAKIVL